MPLSDSDKQKVQQHIIEFFEKTYPLFQETKKYVSLIERYPDEVGKLDLQTVNELRSLLFHVYKLIGATPEEHESVDDFIKENIIEAKEHLYRACFDSYLVTCAIITTRIEQVIKEFSYDVVATAFPKFHQQYVIDIMKIQHEMADINSHRNTSLKALIAVAESNPIDMRWQRVNLLIEIYTVVQATVPAMVAYKQSLEAKKVADEVKEEKKEARADWRNDKQIIWRIIIALSGAAVGAFLMYLGLK